MTYEALRYNKTLKKKTIFILCCVHNIKFKHNEVALIPRTTREATNYQANNESPRQQ